jgi:hypothetical protein
VNFPFLSFKAAPESEVFRSTFLSSFQSAREDLGIICLILTPDISGWQAFKQKGLPLEVMACLVIVIELGH